MWFQAVGDHARVDLWQLSQPMAVPVGMCCGGLPVARLPLWQVWQLPGTTPAWSNARAGSQEVLRWQLSHAAVVGTWFDVLPAVTAPLWQVAQLPGSTPT